jgi:glucosyl-dolichyl phosphate glucuronosyltransferase
MTAEIIIATKDRPEDLNETLNSISDQSSLPEKIFIVDSGERQIDHNQQRDNFKRQGVKYEWCKSKPGLTYQRNLGIKQITEDLIIFLDDDVILDKDYLRSLRKVFIIDNERIVGGATGKCTNYKDNTSTFSVFFRKIFLLATSGKGEVLSSGIGNAIKENINHHINLQWLPGFNMAFRKEIFNNRLFDEKFESYSYLEDLDFSFRVGKEYQLLYVPEARIIHKISPTARISSKNKAKMFVLNHHYLFKKNINQTFLNKIAHYWSLIGLMFQKVFLKRSWKEFAGTLEGVWEIIRRNA